MPKGGYSMRLFFLQVITMKFNAPNSIPTIIEQHPERTTNLGGGVAFKHNAKVELYKRTMTYMVGEPKFYMSPSADMGEMQLLISQVAKEDPEFILKLAAFARKEMYLRSAPVFLLVEACDYPQCKPYIRKYVPHIIQRADEITEVIAYWTTKNGNIGNRSSRGSLPASLKKGLADRFQTLTAYEAGKYKKDDAKVKMSDVIRVTHPKPLNDEMNTLFKQIRTNTVPIPFTWETQVSTRGSTKEVWSEVAPKMPYMAKLRNLRNFNDKGVPLQDILTHITNPAAVKKSMQYPFRFYAAYKELVNTNEDIINALETALELSIENLPVLEGITAGFADVSGSMNDKVSEKSTITMKEIACLYLAMLSKISPQSRKYVFADQIAQINVIRQDSILSIMRQIMESHVGGGTYGHLTIQTLLNQKLKVDRIIIFTDEQMYESGWCGDSVAQLLKEYKAKINPNVYCYVISMHGYPNVAIPKDETRTAVISGWNDRVFEFIKVFENFGRDPTGIIEKYTVGRYSGREM